MLKRKFYWEKNSTIDFGPWFTCHWNLISFFECEWWIMEQDKSWSRIKWNSRFHLNWLSTFPNFVGRNDELLYRKKFHIKFSLWLTDYYFSFECQLHTFVIEPAKLVISFRLSGIEKFISPFKALIFVHLSSRFIVWDNVNYNLCLVQQLLRFPFSCWGTRTADDYI